MARKKKDDVVKYLATDVIYHHTFTDTDRDILMVILDAEKEYTIEQATKLLEKELGRKVIN